MTPDPTRSANNVTHYRHPMTITEPAACGIHPALSTPDPCLTDCPPCLVALNAALTTERDRLLERERHFAEVLGVCDGGQYRNDWDTRIRAVLAERNALKADCSRLTTFGAEMQAERDVAIRERDAAKAALRDATDEAGRWVREARKDVTKLVAAIEAELTHGGIRDRIAQATAILGAEVEKGSRARRAAERLDADRDAFYERMMAAIKTTSAGGQDGE